MAARLQRLCSVEETYAFIKHIGKGSYAEVYLVVPMNKIEAKTRVSVLFFMMLTLLPMNFLGSFVVYLVVSEVI